MIANYESSLAIDNDDGSCFYETFFNFFVYGKGGMTNDFGGHSNHHFENIYAYVEYLCFDISGQLNGNEDMFFNNTCIINQANPKTYGTFDCSDQNESNHWPKLGNNTIYQMSVNASITGLCGLNEQEFQQKYKGIDAGTTINGPPSDENIIEAARQLLFV